MKALTKSVRIRYSSADLMRKDVLAAVAGREVAAPVVNDATQMITALNPEATGVLDPTRVANKMGANSCCYGFKY